MVAQTRAEGEEEGSSGQIQDILKAEPMGFTEGLDAWCPFDLQFLTWDFS